MTNVVLSFGLPISIYLPGGLTFKLIDQLIFIVNGNKNIRISRQARLERSS
jgi:hypothetical protein